MGPRLRELAPQLDEPRRGITQPMACGVSYFPAVRIRIFVIGLIMHRPRVIPHVVPFPFSCHMILNSRHE